MSPKYFPGSEPEEIKPLLNMMLNELNLAFPDKHVVLSEWNHERWDKAAGTLCSYLGYEHGRDFLVSYGYTVSAERIKQSPLKNTDRQEPRKGTHAKPTKNYNTDDEDGDGIINYSVHNDADAMLKKHFKQNRNTYIKKKIFKFILNYKWIFIIIVLFIILGISRACNKSNDNDNNASATVPETNVSKANWVTPNSYVTKKLGGIQFEIGDTWDVKEISDVNTFAIYPYGVDNVDYGFITISCTDSNGDITSVGNLIGIVAQSAFSGDVETTEDEDILIDGIAAKKAKFSVSDGNEKYGGIIAITINNEKMYCFVCEEKGSLSNNMDAAFSAILSSITFVEDTENISNPQITLNYNEQGEYGKQITLNADDEFAYTFFVYTLPSGIYKVKNNNPSGGSQVTIYRDEVVTNEDGVEEMGTSSTEPIVLMAGEEGQLTIADGECVKLSDGSTNIIFEKIA